ncbi:MAG: hypothetical protein V1860_00115 [bacterium]
MILLFSFGCANLTKSHPGSEKITKVINVTGAATNTETSTDEPKITNDTGAKDERKDAKLNPENDRDILIKKMNRIIFKGYLKDEDIRNFPEHIADPSAPRILMPSSLKACNVSLDASKGIPLPDALRIICDECGIWWDILDPSKKEVWLDVAGGKIDRTEVIQTNRPPKDLIFPAYLEKFINRDPKLFKISVTAPLGIIDQVKNFLAKADIRQKKN